MKNRMLDIIACPQCGGAFSCETLVVQKNSFPDGTKLPKCKTYCALLSCASSSANEAACKECYGREIVEAKLTCGKCHAEYKVTGGVPRFVPEKLPTLLRKTRAMFGAQYTNFPVLPQTEWDRHFKSYLDILPDGTITGAGKIGLDAGCGSGRTISIAARHCEEMVGFDITNGVQVAHDVNRSNPNVHVMQADIYNLPLKKEYFDFIYSFGVIHHLPDPEKGFNRISALLKKGGTAAIYVYRKYDDLGHKVSVGVTTAARVITTRLDPAVLSGLCYAFSPIVYGVFVAPRKILEMLKVPARFTKLFPFAQTKKLKYIPAQLFDRFSPPIEYRYDAPEVVKWFTRAGLESTGNSPLYGHVVWGYKK